MPQTAPTTSTGPAPNTRKVYLDWLRGMAVVVMVGAHVIDSWTREADRHDARYFVAVFVFGLAAPLFLFLAGTSLAMSGNARAASLGHRTAAAGTRRRGWQVFGLAFLFRVQSQLLGWGPFVNLLKVDILNVMGLAMVVASLLWSVATARAVRLLLFAGATVLMAMATPLVREARWLDILPDPIEWYLRPAPNRTAFTLLPWAGFLFAGALVGELIDMVKDGSAERRLHLGIFVAGVLGAVLAYVASLQPAIYPVSNFWTSSPTFFFIRLGIITALVPLAWTIERLPWPLFPPLVVMGRSSLFVYWIHVEMAYGALAKPIKYTLPLGGSIVAAFVLCVLLHAIVRWKNAYMASRTLPPRLTFLAPLLR